MPKISSTLAPAILGLFCSCTVIPAGPSVLVLPGTGKDFEQFRGDDAVCRQYAAFQAGGQTPNQAAAAGGLASAAVGTAVGAAAGAAIGGGEGAAVGAGTGLAVGSLAGAGAGAAAGQNAQERFDTGYIQCMYAKGNRVPVSGQVLYQDRRDAIPPPPPPAAAPAKPLPPPPPPRTEPY